MAKTNAEQLGDSLLSLFTTVLAETGAAKGHVVISETEYELLKSHAAEAAELKKQLDGQATIIRNLTTARDTAVQQRDAARAANTVNSSEHAALVKENDDLKHQLRTLQHRVREAEKLASSVQGMVAKPDPRYNKLWKDYTACKNQRDSYRQTIAAQNITIRSLEDQLKSETKVEVPFIVLDSVRYDANEVRQVRDCSIQRAAQINDLTNKLNAAIEGYSCVQVDGAYYTEGNIRQLLNTINQLRRTNENLKQSKPTIQVKGKYMTVGQIEGLMDRNLKYAAEIDRLNAIHKRVASTLRGTTTSVKRERAKRHELEEELKTLRACKEYVDAQGSIISAESRAASYQDQMNQWRDKYVAEADKVKSLEAEVRRLSGPKEVRTQTSTIEVGPNIIELVIKVPENTFVVVGGVKVAADLIPQMAGDLVAKTTEIEGLKKIIDDKTNTVANKDTIIAHKDCQIHELTQRNKNQYDSLCAADKEMERLHTENGRLAEQLAAKDTELNTLRIESRLLKGRANERKQKALAPQVGSTTLQSGETYMTTDIGLVAVNTEGMRILADAYHALKCKVDALSGYLQDWATS